MAFGLPYPICFILVVLVLPFSVTSQTYKNITLGSSLTANGDDSSWVSPSGDFAFGFQQIGTGGYLLAIWFNKIPEKTIVWWANGGSLAPQGSKIQLSTDGTLLLSDPKGNSIWSQSSAGTGVSYAAMLDSGNFVLASKNSATLWQSFDQPTDTLLPTQLLNEGSRLVARFSETNHSSGRFSFNLQTDGNLVFYTTNFPFDSVNSAYNATMTFGSGFQVIFNQSGYVSLIASNGTVLYPLFLNAATTSQLYQRVILEYDGVLRQYVYPKSASSAGGRPMAWSTLSFIPSNICTRIRQSTGGGACGFNSYCILGTDQRPTCGCPAGYTFFDPNDKLSGCKPNFVPQNCDVELQETDHFRFVDMPNTDWPDSDYEYYQMVTEDWCRQVCLNDCLCSVAIFRNGNCWKKRNPVSNGRIDSSVGGKALIKIRRGNSTGKSADSGPGVEE